MKNLVVNYKLFNDKVNKRIVTLADLHDYPGSRRTTLIKDIADLDPELILFAGDILNGSKYNLCDKSYENLKRFLSELSEISPVLLGLGNHDLFNASGDFEYAYRDLDTARKGRVYPLFNDSVVIGDTRITEFHTRHSAFAPASQESGHALIQFIEDAKKDLFIPKENDPLYNILICHNPKIVRQARSIAYQQELRLTGEERFELEKISKIIKLFDMIDSGHLHNGYRDVDKTISNPSKYLDYGYWEMPREKNIEGNVTLIRPWVLKRTDMCRGTAFIGDGKSRILQLSDESYYEIKDDNSKQLDSEEAWKKIDKDQMTPIVITGGVNKFFNFPIDKSEITQVKVLKR